MIDITGQIDNLEKIMQLMEKYKIDEVAVDFINVKRSKNIPFTTNLTPEQIIDQHTNPIKKAEEISTNRINETLDWIEGV